MGPIINGIVIGAITTSMTSIQLEEDPKIYGARVAALHNSFEYNLGVRRNAKLNDTGTCIIVVYLLYTVNSLISGHSKKRTPLISGQIYISRS